MIDVEKLRNGIISCREQQNPPGWSCGGCIDCPYRQDKRENGGQGCVVALLDDMETFINETHVTNVIE